MLNTALAMLCALLLDRLFGEPRRFHPLVGFGRYAAWLERQLNHGGSDLLLHLKSFRRIFFSRYYQSLALTSMPVSLSFKKCRVGNYVI